MERLIRWVAGGRGGGEGSARDDGGERSRVGAEAQASANAEVATSSRAFEPGDGSRAGGAPSAVEPGGQHAESLQFSRTVEQGDTRRAMKPRDQEAHALDASRASELGHSSRAKEPRGCDSAPSAFERGEDVVLVCRRAAPAAARCDTRGLNRSIRLPH